MTPLLIRAISLPAFNTTLSRYAETAASALAELDALRYETIPAKLGDMKGAKSLLKSDVEKLVEWKLKHGTYRPALMKLVQSNPAEVIKSTTQNAFASLNDDNDVLKALKILTALRGIGPATASLLLSVYSPDAVPFFSDELFRWTHWESMGQTGWERSIKYNATEYKEVLAAVEDLRSRLGVTAVDAEKVAYVLGKEGVDVGVKGGDENDGKIDVDEVEDLVVSKGGKSTVTNAAAGVDVEEIKKDTSTRNRDDGKRKKADVKETREKRGEVLTTEEKDDSVEKATTSADKKGAKRKAQEEKPSAEAIRRSTRKKAWAL